MSFSIVNLINKFSVTSVLCLAIFVASIRTSLARISIFLEWAGISVSLFVAFIIALGIYLYLYVSRRLTSHSEDQLEEEMNMLDEMQTDPSLTSQHLPVIVLWELESRPHSTSEGEDSIETGVSRTDGTLQDNKYK